MTHDQAGVFITIGLFLLLVALILARMEQGK